MQQCDGEDVVSMFIVKCVDATPAGLFCLLALLLYI